MGGDIGELVGKPSALDAVSLRPLTVLPPLPKDVILPGEDIRDTLSVTVTVRVATPSRSRVTGNSSPASSLSVRAKPKSQSFRSHVSVNKMLAGCNGITEK